MGIDRLAPWYQAVEYAAFGRALERCRFAYLDRLKDARRILLAGEGDGRVLQRLLAIAPRATFDVIDASPVMIQLSKSRAGHDPRVRFRCEDIRTARLDTYDAAAVFFFLDWFGEADARTVAAVINDALAPGGIWLHGDFAVPPGGRWQRRHAEVWLWTMYRFFGLPGPLPPLPAILAEAGLRRVEGSTQRWGMIASEMLRKPPVG